jgi:hypothetical protein
VEDCWINDATYVLLEHEPWKRTEHSPTLLPDAATPVAKALLVLKY